MCVIAVFTVFTVSVYQHYRSVYVCLPTSVLGSVIADGGRAMIALDLGAYMCLRCVYLFYVVFTWCLRIHRICVYAVFIHFTMCLCCVYEFLLDH